MIKEVDLVSYLPPFMTDYKEITVALEAENPEFVLLWKAKERVFSNEFIETADEYGISRFEKMLNILPSKEDTLESRRSRVQARWFTAIPYTVSSLMEKLANLSPNNDFLLIKDFASYRIIIETSFTLFGEVEEVEKLLEMMIPCNIVVETYNKISTDTTGTLAFGGAISQALNFTINTELDEQKAVSGVINYAGYISDHKTVAIGMSTDKHKTLNGVVSYVNVISEHKNITMQ